MTSIARTFTVVVLVLLAGCSREPAHSRIDVALATLIPSDTIFVAGMRIDKLKSTPFYKAYIEGRQIKQLEDFALKTGLDPRKDLWELLFITNGKTPLMMVRGKFGGLFGQEPRFEGLGTERRNYKGYNILGSKTSGVVFMNTTVALAGPPTDLERIIDNRDKKSEIPPQALIEMVAQLPGSAQVYAATTNGGALLPALPVQGNLANLGRAMASMQKATMWADLGDGVDLHGAAFYADSTSAAQVRDAARGLIGLGRLSTPTDQPAMLKLFDGIQVAARDNQLTVTINAPFELVDQVTRRLATIIR